MVEKLIGIDGYDLEIPLADHLAIFTYDDRPGIIGTFGRILGERGINIGAMQVARSESGDKALVVLTADSEIPHEIGAEIAEAIGSESFTVVNL